MPYLMRRSVFAGGLVCSFLLMLHLTRHLNVPNVTSCGNTPVDTLERARKEKVSYRHNLTVSREPTLSFRDNLWSDKKYITSWGSAGYANDVLTYINLIYVAIMMERIPILPPPSTSGAIDTGERIYFNQIFDVDALSESLQWPILDWSDVKAPESKQWDALGCWFTWSDSVPRWSAVPPMLFVDSSYTHTPPWSSLPGGGPMLSAVYTLSFPTGRRWALENPTTLPSPEKKHKDLPDQHLFCFDYLFYAGLTFPRDTFGFDWSVGWNKVARHAHFTPLLLDGAKRHLRKLFDISPREALPPFIAIHIRRGDFGGWCSGKPIDECFAPLSAYGVRVKEIQEELLSKKDLHVRHVVFSSDDDESSGLYKEAASLGWKRLAFDKDDAEMALRKTLSGWTTTLMDPVLHSLAVGFVGTETSTYSLLSKLRVEDWNGGVIRTVKWGHKGADDH